VDAAVWQDEKQETSRWSQVSTESIRMKNEVSNEVSNEVRVIEIGRM
jgi:hypothetical protein